MGASETSPPSSSSVFRTNSAADCAISLDLPMMRPSPLAPSVPFQSFLALDHTQAACIPQHDGVEGCDDLDVQGEDQQEGKTKMQGSQPILIPTASEMRKLKMLKKDLNLTSPSSLDLDLPIMHPLPPFPNFHRVSTPIRLLRNGIGSGRGEDVNLRANNGNGQSRTTSRPIYPITTHSLKNKQRIRSKIPMRNLHAAFEELPTRPWTPSPRIPSPPHWLLNPTTGFPLNLDLDIGGSERKYPKLTPCLDGADQFDPRHNLLSSFHHPQRQVSSFASRPDTDTGSAPRDRRLLSAWTTPRTPCLGPTKNLPLPPSFPSSYLGERGAKGSKRPRSAAYDASQACKKEQEQKIVQIEVKLRDVMVALESTCSSSSLLPTSPSESASKLSTAAHGEEGAVEVVLTVKVRKGMKVSLIVDAAEC
ncbi:hypothetical protein BDU57DRAFT_525091 [Ampelomyces quisqualis]|uniref:Uncharacterized protein n=1 Tax=Ampelomyces quisqualis TaxID=50730 RepID=A0A6A5Q639_AMPQU|nr:hypothetical protein BDU57DRAFT_525091 [Ampelomyces quisqualis]